MPVSKNSQQQNWFWQQYLLQCVWVICLLSATSLSRLGLTSKRLRAPLCLHCCYSPSASLISPATPQAERSDNFHHAHKRECCSRGVVMSSARWDRKPTEWRCGSCEWIVERLRDYKNKTSVWCKRGAREHTVVLLKTRAHLEAQVPGEHRRATTPTRLLTDKRLTWNSLLSFGSTDNAVAGWLFSVCTIFGYKNNKKHLLVYRHFTSQSLQMRKLKKTRTPLAHFLFVKDLHTHMAEISVGLCE